MVHFRYAYNEKGEQIDIDSIQRNQGKYKCLCCGTDVIPHFIGETGHHFQHKSRKNCSKESYLHILAKNIFLDIFVECLKNKVPYYVVFTQYKKCNYYEEEYGLKCSHRFDQKINLLDYFTDVEVEIKEGNFKPDLRLLNTKTNVQIFIEIKVTHESSFKKITSGYRIIEISINSENDLEIIKNKLISEVTGQVRFYNFKREINDDCGGNCRVIHYFLSLNKNGKATIQKRNLKQIKGIINNNVNQLVTYKMAYYNCYDGYKVYRNFIKECNDEGYKIINCFFCQNREFTRIQDSNGELYEFINWRRVKGKSGQWIKCLIEGNEEERHCNYALRCPDFALDSNLYKLYE